MSAAAGSSTTAPGGFGRPAPRVLVTAGPTHEPIDAVRYLANRSSGRMGIAIAEASAQRGWPTTLLLGPTAAQSPISTSLQVARFRTAAELQALLEAEWPGHDLLIMAAAVADYRPAGNASAPREPGRPGPIDPRTSSSPEGRATPPAGKIKRDSDGLVLHLEATPDLLAGMARTRQPGQRLIGFALEPADGLEDAARAKLERKGIDAIVANPLETMDAETVDGRLIWRDGRVDSPGGEVMGKNEFAAWLVERLGEAFAARS